jgi:hypothetical protein
MLTIVSCKKDNVPPESPLSSPATSSYDGDFLQDYFSLQCDIVRTTPGFLPTQASRAYGYLGVTSYEAVVHGIPNAQSLVGQIQGFTPGSLPTPDLAKSYNWALACNAACAQMMRYMFGTNLSADNLALIDQMEADNQNSLSQSVSDETLTNSINFGIDLADAIYDISTTDGGHEAYLDPFSTANPLIIPPDDYCWVPTGAQPAPLSPYWSNNRSFIAGVASNSQVSAHIPFSTDESSEFYAAAMEVYNQVTTLNGPEEVTITEYWADDPFATCTPTGHTFNIIKQMCSEADATLEKTAVAFGMMGIAENDAFISCWKSKYDYVLIRPVSYIQQYIDPSFETVIGTPPFPAYTSGHSAEIGAGTKVMIALFAEENGDYTFTDLSQIQYGFSARSFDNLYDMANECALSRYYGGIHYTFDNDKGLELGFAVGDAVLNDINWPTDIE